MVLDVVAALGAVCVNLGSADGGATLGGVTVVVLGGVASPTLGAGVVGDG